MSEVTDLTVIEIKPEQALCCMWRVDLMLTLSKSARQ